MKILLLFPFAAFASISAKSLISDQFLEGYDDICEGILYQAFAYPDDRNKFIGCAYGIKYILKCQHDDDIFEPETISCVNKESKESSESSEDSIKKTTTNKSHETTADSDCHRSTTKSTTTNRSTTTRSTSIKSSTAGSTTEKMTTRTFTTLGTTAESTITERPGTTEPDSGEITTKTFTDQVTTTSPDEWMNSTIFEPSTSSSFTSTTERDIVISFTCPIGGYGNIPSSISCNRYYECISGVQYTRTCPEDLFFDAISLECKPLELALCADSIKCA